MVKKGKFKLLNYLIKDYLIFYKSLNKRKKLVGLSIFKIENILKIKTTLDNLLHKRYLYYYSIQIEPSDKKKVLILLCFADADRNNIIKFFNLTHQSLLDHNDCIKFYKNKTLEKKYLMIISKSKPFNSKYCNINDSISIKAKNYERFIDYYDVMYLNFKNPNKNLRYLLNLIKNLKQKGFLIIHFKIQYNKIFSTVYFIHIKETDTKNSLNLENEVNNFFNLEILKKHHVNTKEIFFILWRLNFSNNFYPIHNFSDFFSLEEVNRNYSLSEINYHVEQLLKSNQIKYHRLNQNLLFIEQTKLLIILREVNFNLILKIIKKYYSKYMIYIIIMNEEQYEKIVKIEKIKFLDNLKIINYRDFIDLNSKKLNELILLKNT